MHKVNHKQMVHDLHFGSPPPSHLFSKGLISDAAGGVTFESLSSSDASCICHSGRGPTVLMVNQS